MIVKELEVPLIIRKLEALLRRLPQIHPQRSKIEGELARRWAGYRGEQALHYPLSFLPDKEYHILFNLRLYDGAHFFQMDLLLLSPKLLLILEVKNYAGTILFDQEFKQLVRTLAEKEEAFPDPILQVERHKIQLREWLALKKIPPSLPIETLVVVSSPHTLIKSSLSGLSKKVTHLSSLKDQIASFEKLHVKEVISPSQLKKLSRLLIKNDCPHQANILERFQISYDELNKGIQCSGCLMFSMYRFNHGWKCRDCSEYSKTAHLTGLQDYAFLVGVEVANRQLKDFLQLSSSCTAKRILQSLNVPFTGNYKNRKYQLTCFDQTR